MLVQNSKPQIPCISDSMIIFSPKFKQFVDRFRQVTLNAHFQVNNPQN